MFVHVFQIIPLALLFSNFSQSHLVDLQFLAPEFYLLSITAVVNFYSSLVAKHPWGKNLFVLSVSFLYLLVLNKMYALPSLGVLMSSFYIIFLFKLNSRSDLADRFDSYSVLWPFAISSFIYLVLKFEWYQDINIMLLATNLSFASLLFYIGAKTNILKTFRIVASVVVVFLSFLLINLHQIEPLKAITNIWFVTCSALTIITLVKHGDRGLHNLTGNLFRYPEATIFSYFIGLSLLGAIFLEFPLSRTNALPFSFLDSFFTAMSAVCVTGLIVFDTPFDLSYFGQWVVLILIQMGGFGIVSLSSWVLLGLQSRRMSIEHEHVLKEMSGHEPSLTGMQSTLKKIFLYFFCMELIGAVVLFLAFLQYDANPSQALWRAVFTSISAFCNAGFALQSDSLIPYQQDPIILLTTSFLIIAGGFAPLMALNLPSRWIKKNLNLQEKLVLYSTFYLLSVGFFYFVLAEWNHSLGHLSFFDKLTNSWFQSVTTRTAGFNSVDFSQFSSFTPFFMMILMFIGGNPGGTAGGIKTVTFMLIVASGLAGIRGESHLRIFNRHISSKALFRTLAIFSGAAMTTLLAFFMLCYTQNIEIVSLLFETISAVGTVGLSTGATGQLDEIGKIIIILCMLLGRVGPLAFILLLFRNQTVYKWKVPREDIYIS